MLALESSANSAKVDQLSSLPCPSPKSSEGEKLFLELNNRFSRDGEVEDSITDDHVMRHAQLFFDAYAPQDQSPPEITEKLLTILPEIYFSASSMKVRAPSLEILLIDFLGLSFSRLSLTPLKD
jgi:hypothetical protein